MKEPTYFSLFLSGGVIITTRLQDEETEEAFLTGLNTKEISTLYNCFIYAIHPTEQGLRIGINPFFQGEPTKNEVIQLKRESILGWMKVPDIMVKNLESVINPSKIIVPDKGTIIKAR